MPLLAILTTAPAHGGYGGSISELQFGWGGTPHSLVGYTVVNRGAELGWGTVVGDLNDGVVEVVNSLNITFWEKRPVDFYVDMQTPVPVQLVRIAPRVLATYIRQILSLPSRYCVATMLRRGRSWQISRTSQVRTVGSPGIIESLAGADSLKRKTPAGSRSGLRSMALAHPLPRGANPMRSELLVKGGLGGRRRSPGVMGGASSLRRGRTPGQRCPKLGSRPLPGFRWTPLEKVRKAPH